MPLGHDLAVEYDNPVSETFHLLEVLAREQNRCTSCGQFLDHIPDLESSGRVEAGRRFVEEQQGRFRDQRCAEVETAAHATRVGGDAAISGAGEVE